MTTSTLIKMVAAHTHQQRINPAQFFKCSLIRSQT